MAFGPAKSDERCPQLSDFAGTPVLGNQYLRGPLTPTYPCYPNDQL